MPEKKPYLEFYTDKFLVGTMGMDWCDIGRYITILAMMHQKGRMSESAIKKVIGEITDDVRSKFQVDEHNKWYNVRLENLKEPEPEKEDSKLYVTFIKIYDSFLKAHASVPAKIDVKEGAAAKKIITYLKTTSKDTTDEGILLTWGFILNNWSKIESFLQNQLKLAQINSNIVNIINQLRNGRNGTKQSATKDSNGIRSDNPFGTN